MADLQQSIEKDLLEMQSFEAIRYVLNDIELHDIQCIDIMKMLYSKRCMVIYDTGLGKTYLTAAFVKLLCNEDASRKFLMLVKKSQLIQTPKKLGNACGKTVLTTSADAKSLKSVIDRGLTTASVLMLTHECLSNDKIMSELFSNKDKFCGIIIDEAHDLSNFNRTNSGGMLEAVCRSFEYCIALTATPITTDALQLAKLAHVIAPERYPNYSKLKRMLCNGSFDIDDDKLFFISRSNRDFGSIRDYHGSVVFVKPMPGQTKVCGGAKLMQLCKGAGAINQVEALIDLIKQRESQRGLVYINQYEILNWVMPFLDEAGIRYACINGSTKNQERAEVMHEFNDCNTLDVVLTSVTTAIDLDCDYVIFYEFTVMMKQMIGRAHRGIGDKCLDIIFILTEDSSELDYFAENIIKRCLFVRDILHKEFKEIEDADRSLKTYME